MPMVSNSRGIGWVCIAAFIGLAAASTASRADLGDAFDFEQDIHLRTSVDLRALDDDDEESAVWHKLALHARLEMSEHVRLVGRLPGLKVSERDTDLQEIAPEGYVTLDAGLRPVKLSLRMGRMPWYYRERTRGRRLGAALGQRMFDGLRLRVGQRRWTLDVFYAEPSDGEGEGMGGLRAKVRWRGFAVTLLAVVETESDGDTSGDSVGQTPSAGLRTVQQVGIFHHLTEAYFSSEGDGLRLRAATQVGLKVQLPRAKLSLTAGGEVSGALSDLVPNVWIRTTLRAGRSTRLQLGYRLRPGRLDEADNRVRASLGWRPSKRVSVSVDAGLSVPSQADDIRQSSGYVLATTALDL